MITLRLILLVIIISITTGCKESPKNIFVFTKTAGYRHDNIAFGVDALKKIGQRANYNIHHSEDSTHFTIEHLSNYDAILFFNTTGNILNEKQQSAFETYIKNGGGFVGIHAATDTEYDWPWYGKMVGAYFNDHPEIQEADLRILNHTHLSTAHFDTVWTKTDEWYNFKDINQDVQFLISIDENSYEGGNLGEFHPMSWYHEYDGGKAFYTGMGHTKASFENPLFLHHLIGGIDYVTQ